MSSLSSRLRKDALLPALPALAEGPLCIKIGDSNWQRMHVQLKSVTLFIYRDSSLRTLADTVNLRGYRVVAYQERNSSDPLMFKLVHETQLPYSFKSVESFDCSVQEWLNWFAIACQESTLEDFDFICQIGKGSYGAVALVSYQKTRSLLALKRISKDISSRMQHLADEKKEVFDDRLRRRVDRSFQYVLAERAILETLEHPYIVTLRQAFETEGHWYFVMDYLPGGDVYEHARVQPGKRFDEEIVQIWAAQLVSALEYMHSLQIVHRDIKPENLMLDLDGNAHLADFGFARSLRTEDGSTGMTTTFCGTKYYIAPEMIHGTRMYSTQVDYWSLGAVLYELLYGVPPFVGNTRDEQFSKILLREPDYPRHAMLSEACVDFLKQLLIKDPAQRLGCRNVIPDGELTEIRCHPFFANIDWEEIERKLARPLYLPRCRLVKQPRTNTRATHVVYSKYDGECHPVAVQLRRIAPSPPEVLQSWLEPALPSYSYFPAEVYGFPLQREYVEKIKLVTVDKISNEGLPQATVHLAPAAAVSPETNTTEQTDPADTEIIKLPTGATLRETRDQTRQTHSHHGSDSGSEPEYVEDEACAAVVHVLSQSGDCVV